MGNGAYDACIIQAGTTVDSIVEFTRAPFHQKYSALVAQYGEPMPGNYRLLDSDVIPEYKIWKRWDGTLIAAKQDVATKAGVPVRYTMIVVFKR